MRCAPGDLKILNVEMLQILRAPLRSHAPYVAGLSATLLSIAIEGGNVVLRLRIVWALVLIATIDVPCRAFDLVEPLPQGGETAFTVSIVNPTTNSAASVAFESIPVVSILPGVYVLESLSSPQCEIQNGVLDANIPVVLSVAPVPARSTVHCSLKIRRSLTSDQPAGLEFKPSPNTPADIYLSSVDWVFGPVVDLALHVEQIQPFPAVGEHTGFVRVAVHNTGPWYIDQVNFGYCQDLVVAPFELDNALPDGCAEAGFGPTCWDVGEPSIQFSVVGLSPGETKSCVLRATAHEPLTEPIRFGISLVEDVYVEGDDLLHDFDESNDRATLEIAPISGAQRPVSVPISPAAVAALIGIFLALGAAAATERVRRSSWV